MQNITNDSSCWCKIFSWICFNVHLYKEFRIFCMQWKSLLLFPCIVGLILMMTFIFKLSPFQQTRRIYLFHWCILLNILWERKWYYTKTRRALREHEFIRFEVLALINTKLFPRFSNTDVEKYAFPTVEKDRCDFHPGYWVYSCLIPTMNS